MSHVARRVHCFVSMNAKRNTSARCIGFELCGVATTIRNAKGHAECPCCAARAKRATFAKVVGHASFDPMVYAVPSVVGLFAATFAF